MFSNLSHLHATEITPNSMITDEYTNSSIIICICVTCSVLDKELDDKLINRSTCSCILTAKRKRLQKNTFLIAQCYKKSAAVSSFYILRILNMIALTRKIKLDNSDEKMKLDNDFSQLYIDELNGFVQLAVKRCPNQTDGKS